MNHVGRLAEVALLAVALGGCDKAPELPSINQIQQAVTNQVEEVKQVTASAGQVELELDKPYQTTGCYGSIYRLAAPLQSVLQVTSYNDPSGESFPSFFARAILSDAGDVAPGKQLAAEVLFQPNPNSLVWQSPPGETVEIKVTSVKDGQFEAEMSGPMISSDDPTPKLMSGKLSGSLATPVAK
jgi:hypothetical protein